MRWAAIALGTIGVLAAAGAGLFFLISRDRQGPPVADNQPLKKAPQKEAEQPNAKKNTEPKKKLAELRKRFIVQEDGANLFVSPSEEDVCNNDLAMLKDFPQVADIQIADARSIDDTGMAHLQHLPRLRRLTVTNGKFIGDKGVAPLARSKALRELALIRVEKLTDAGLESLKDLKDLTALQLEELSITDAGLIHLRELQALTLLSLENSKKITSIEAVSEMKQLFGLLVGGTSLDDKSTTVLKGLTKLEVLQLQGTKITDAALANLPDCALQVIDLRDIQGLKGPGLRHLKRFGNIKGLNLEGTSVDDAGLAHLKDMTQLEGLQLAGLVTDAGLEHLAALDKLRTLHINDAKNLTGAGLKHVKALPLQYLSLTGSGITDDGTVDVKDMKKLIELNLTDTRIGDATLDRLHKLDDLRLLDVRNTNVTAAAVNRLRKANAELGINR